MGLTEIVADYERDKKKRDEYDDGIGERLDVLDPRFEGVEFVTRIMETGLDAPDRISVLGLLRLQIAYVI
jgi:hypothetical protein